MAVSDVRDTLMQLIDELIEGDTSEMKVVPKGLLDTKHHEDFKGRIDKEENDKSIDRAIEVFLKSNRHELVYILYFNLISTFFV